MNNYKLPQLLPHCQTPAKQFCESCRNKTKGRTFRKGVLERQNIQNVHEDFECPLGKPWNEETQQSQPTKSQQAKNATKAITKGISSTVKTSVFRKDRVTDEEYNERLSICTNCPGNHAVFKNGALFTCGKFANSITGKLPTCGCVLTKKARDAKQDCPMKYWPTINKTR